MPTTRQPLRTSADCTLHDVGADWDAIRVPKSVGLQAVSILGPRCGAVVEDPMSGVLYWFLSPGSASQWEVANTKALAAGTTVTIPPPRRAQGPGPHWRVCPGDSNWLTDARALQAVLEDCLHFGDEPEWSA